MKNQMLPTGLKAIDLFVPLPLGGDILVTGEPRSGTRVLGTEIAYRLSHFPQGAMAVTVFLDSAMADAADFEEDFKISIPEGARLVVTTEVTERLLKEQPERKPGKLGNAIFAVTNESGFSKKFLLATKARRSAESRSLLTAFVISGVAPAAQFSAIIVLRCFLAAEAIYPSIDVEASTSIVSTQVNLTPTHRRVAAEARESIRQVLRGVENGMGRNDDWEHNAVPEKRPPLQALRFLSQPYFSAEPFTGISSAFVPVATTVEDFRAILDGEHFATPPQKFQMLNSLPSQTV